MKLILNSLFMLALPAAITAKAISMTSELATEIENCQVQFGTQIEANYSNADTGVAPMCTVDEFMAIANVVHSIVEVDWIASLMGTSMPDFVMGYETFEAGAHITNPDLVDGFDPMEMIGEMTLEDIKYDIEMEGCGENDPSCNGLNTEAPTSAPSVAPSSVPSAAPTAGPTKGPTAGPTSAPTDASESDSSEDPVVSARQPVRTRGAVGGGGRRLQEAEVVESTGDWTPINAAGPFGHGSGRRELGITFDCPSYRDCNNAFYCCTLCSICKRRRRLGEGNCKMLRTSGSAQTEKEKEAVRKFELRVSSLITKALKRLARKGVKCLGNPWELEAIFFRHYYEEVCDV